MSMTVQFRSSAVHDVAQLPAFRQRRQVGGDEVVGAHRPADSRVRCEDEVRGVPERGVREGVGGRSSIGSAPPLSGDDRPPARNGVVPEAGARPPVLRDSSAATIERPTTTIMERATGHRPPDAHVMSGREQRRELSVPGPQAGGTTVLAHRSERYGG
jgi:hypothetical protein